MAEFIIVADDLTGANDTGVQFAKQGYETVSLLDVGRFEESIGADVLVINGETRALSPKQAYAQARKIAEKLPIAKVKHVYKKIDSTLRGNIGWEIDAFMDALSFDAAVVAPAYPQNGRVTVGGYHLVNGILLEETEVAHDPKCPVQESHLPSLLSSQSKREVGRIDLRCVRGREKSLHETIRIFIEQGKQIIVFDSFSQGDLSRIVDVFMGSSWRVLWVGSAGLAEKLVKYGHPSRNAALPPTARKSAKGNHSLLVVAGSVSSVTRKQIEGLVSREKCRVVSVSPVSLLENGADQELALTVQHICESLEGGLVPVLTTEISETSQKRLSRWMEQNQKDGLAMGNLIAERLGEVVFHVMEKKTVHGLVLTGGDIAYQTLKRIGARALKIIGDVEEGIPFSSIAGGKAEGTFVVTKAGSFGNDLSLMKAVAKLKSLAATHQQRDR